MIRWFKILIGTLCMAMAVNFVYEPMHMVTGGVSGTAIIIKGLSMNWSDFEIPVWMTNILLNIPILSHFPSYIFQFFCLFILI